MLRLVFRLDGVQETDNIGGRRVKLVPRSKGLESKKEEVADDVLVVMVQPETEVISQQGNNPDHAMTHLSRHATTLLTPSSSSAYSSSETKARLLPSASWLAVTLT